MMHGESVYLKVTKFSDTPNLAILVVSLNLVHAKPAKCMVNYLHQFANS